MLKYILFDLDDTIIKDDESDILDYMDALKKCGYDENAYKIIYDVIDDYNLSLTEENMYYNKQDLLNFINENLNQNYDMKLVDELAYTVGNCWTKKVLIDEEIIKELSQKYTLCIYTNFFEELQAQRIKNIGYDKYFSKYFGADRVGVKPFKKSMENVLKELNATPEECIMIGDSKHTDILAANTVGMHSILYDYNGKRDKPEIQATNYTVIKDFSELKNILL